MAASLALLVAVFAWRCHQRQFGGYDEGLFVDIGWRQICGQTPGVDFPCSYPILYVILDKIAMQMFGNNFAAFSTMTAVASGAVLFWVVLLLVRISGLRLASIIAGLAIVYMTVASTFWSYDTLSAAMVCVYFLSAMALHQQPGSRFLLASYGLALMVLAGMKPNTAGIAILGISAILMTDPRTRFKVVATSLAAAVAFIVILTMNHTTPFVVLRSYLAVANRLIPGPGHFMTFLTTIERWSTIGGMILILCPAVGVVITKNRRVSHGDLICFVAILAGIVGWLQNYSQFQDMSVALIGVYCLCLVNPCAWRDAFVLMLCCAFLSCGAAYAVCRKSVEESGIPLFFEYNGYTHTIPDGFFKDLKCGNVMAGVFDESARVLASLKPWQKPWFGPRMKWGYAWAGIPSPIGGDMPMWEPGTTFARSEEKDRFDKFMNARFDVLILFKNDLTYYTPEEIGRITGAYDIDNSGSTITVLRLKHQ
jgi:hypothetical protein